MIITQSVIDIINRSVSDVPPETGGILGSSDGKQIDHVVMDMPGTNHLKMCAYYPNVAFLNQTIAQWQDNGVSFMGLFHTHFFGVRTLSIGDRKYIREIMNAMPESVDKLYFPLFVLPEREMVCYKALRTNRSAEVSEEAVIFQTQEYQ